MVNCSCGNSVSRIGRVSIVHKPGYSLKSPVRLDKTKQTNEQPPTYYPISGSFAWRFCFSWSDIEPVHQYFISKHLIDW